MIIEKSIALHDTTIKFYSQIIFIKINNFNILGHTIFNLINNFGGNYGKK